MFNLTEEEKIRDQIEREEDARIIYRNEIDYAKSEGYKEGIEEGIEEGKRYVKISIVKNLLGKKMNIKEISEIVGLTEDEVNNIIESINEDK